MTDHVPHVWHTTDSDGGDRRHLAMCEEGAVQAHLLHYGMLGYNGQLSAVDEGRITIDTDRKNICLDPHCVMYALTFSENSPC